MVIDPKSLLEEMNALKAQGVDPSNLQISTRAHVVFPYHIRLDEAEEARKGNRKMDRAMQTRLTVLASASATSWTRTYLLKS